jgi:tripartite-type tricarboxylate transporter receptor subunit TctC
MRCTAIRSAACWLAACALVPPAAAQAWPGAQIRLIVPFAAASTNDAIARLLATPMSASLGTTIVVDNRPGANGNIGAEMAARSPADGNTVMMTNTTHATSATLYDKLNYDLVRDLAPVSLLCSGAYFLVTHPSLPVRSFKELVAFARARPGQVNIATAGSGGFLWVELLNSVTGASLRNIPYKSTPQVTQAVLSGEVAVGSITTVQAIQQLKAGRLRGQVVSSGRRSAIVTDVPTIVEAGYRELEATTWYGLMVPAGTPKEIVARLHAESVKALNQPDVRERFDNLDMQPIGSTPAEFGAFVVAEVERWREVAKRSGTRPE